MAEIKLADLVHGDPLHEAACIIALVRAKLVPPFQLSGILQEVGSAVELAQRSEEDRLFKPDDASHKFVGAVTSEDVADAVSDIELWRRRSLDLRTVLEPSYPACLRTIFNHPPFIFIEGAWSDLECCQAVAVVGTREATREGLKRAARLSRELCEAGFTVASGLARGVDTAAHSAAIESGGRTVAVMGTGVYHRYPKENAPLAEKIVQCGGALLSQFFPDQTPRPWHFPERNVVMSGVSIATVVVEASKTSGAKMQARVALQHGRPVFLLQSLVERHDWARKYVEEGAYGTHAIAITATSDLVDRVHSREATPLSA